MSLTGLLIVIIILWVVLIGLLAFAMLRPRHLRPHRPNHWKRKRKQ